MTTRTTLQHRVTDALVSSTLVVALVLLAATSAAADERNAVQGSEAKSIEGTWLVNVTQRNCQSGLPLASFVSLLTFAQGGTMTGTTGSQAFAIGQRGADHGTWKQAGSPHGYSATSIALIGFATSPSPPVSPGFEAGLQTIAQLIAMTDADHFTSEAVIRFFRADGSMYRQGCATADGLRFV